MGDDSGMDALHILEFSFNFNRLSKFVFIAAVTPTQILIQLLDQLHPQWHHNAFMTFEKVPDQMFLPCSICAQR
ncbi:hypothetical protein HanPSC8_Chr11g0486441 [Helianthus annuus]|nr:hypothetical protein HanPSC8_Chr11g0486441 [Helianthus annuus]